MSSRRDIACRIAPWAVTRYGRSRVSANRRVRNKAIPLVPLYSSGPNVRCTTVQLLPMGSIESPSQLQRSPAHRASLHSLAPMESAVSRKMLFG